ncbi:hemolytic lectin LSLc [Armillaria luteobubalina]|uniref:Hemolytic lectin LSLc n=1 Tax=Armillaria luteobubalina TaxID=153913 RepID=A0AA39PXL9_9AGAR|nr:hemolytic lectin LSLc [Armillaria luteobubalina]
MSIYIPPEGLYFRLFAIESKCVLYSRPRPTPQVWQYKGDQEYEDQLFTLIHGTGNRAGLYAIKGKATGWMLYSRASPDPRVGHVDQNKMTDYCWFRFPVGVGEYSKDFRILCPASDYVLFSRLNQNPNFGNYTSKGVHGDQYFTMKFEDMVVKSVDYDVAQGKILDVTPRVLANQTLKNNTDYEQEMSFSFSESVTQTSKFEYSTGFTITVGMEFSVGIPLVAEGKISTSVSQSNVWTFGTEDSFSKTYTANFPVRAGPHTTVRGVSSVQQGTLEVPYTLHLVSKSAGVSVETKGIWRGVSSWALKHEIRVEEA